MASIRTTGPCQPSMALAGPMFSYLRNPYPHVSGGLSVSAPQGWGAHMGDSQILGTWTRTDCKLHINCLELKAVVSALKHWAPMLQGHQVMIATDNSTVVSYINKQGGTPSPTLLRLTVELLLWLEAQNIIVRARHIPGCLNVIADHLSRPNQPISVPPPRDRETYLQALGDTRSRHICDSVELPPSSVHVSSSRAKNPSSGCSVSGLAGDVNVHVSSISSAQQSHSEAPVHPGGRSNSRSPLVAETSWFPHLLRLCVEHPLAFPYRQDLLSQQDQNYVSDGKSYHLHAWRLSCDTIKQQAFQTRSLGSQQPLGGPQPIACTTIGGFASLDGPQGKGLIRLTPQQARSNSRSPLVAETVVVSTPTSSLCGTPPGVSVPSRSSVPAGSEVCLGRKVVPSARMEALMRHYKAAGFSDEVSRLAAAPRRPSTNLMYDDRWLSLSRWAAGQGFDPLEPTAAQIASFLFTLFDTHGLSPQTVKGYRTCLGSVLNRTGKAKVVLHKTISDMIASMELQRPKVKPVLPQWDLGIVLEALSKPPYEPLREASFSHLTLKTVFLLAMASAGRRSELQALRFDQNYIQFKPKGAGVTLYFSPTIVDSHAAIQNSRNLSGSVKAHEVRAVATSLQLFNKVDLHSVMKAGRWSSGGTFTSFYLRDLCPQADSLQRAGPIVAAGDVVRISSS